MARRRSRSRASAEKPEPEAVLHTHLVFVRAADSDQLDAILKPAALESRCVRRIGDRGALFPRVALPALRKRLAALGIPALAAGAPSTGENRETQ